MNWEFETGYQFRYGFPLVFFKSSYNSSYERGDILMFSPLLSSPLHSSISITARSCPHSSPQTLVTHETNDKKAGRRNKGERERERAQPNIRHNQWKGSMYEKKKREEFNYDIFSRASQLWTASLATPWSLQWIEK